MLAEWAAVREGTELLRLMREAPDALALLAGVDLGDAETAGGRIPVLRKPFRPRDLLDFVRGCV